MLDEWIAREVQPRLWGRAFVVRYADDFVIGFTREDEWCRLHRHHPIAEQHQTLSQKLRGHFAYYGITGNSIRLARFRQAVQRVWWEWLGRGRGGNRPTWAKFLQFEQRWPLPPPIATRSVCRVRSEGVT